MEDHGSSRAKRTDAAKSRLKPSEVLTGAADLIAKPFRWTQYRERREHRFLPTSVCAVGAMAEVSGEAGRGPRPAVDLARAYADKAVPEYGGILRFNDERGRKKSEVIAALRRAAELAREDGR